MKGRIHFGDIVLIVAGGLALALGVAWLSDPAHIAPGGASGVAILVKGVTERLGWAMPLSLTTALVNVPLFAVAWRQRGFRFVARSILSTAVFTGALALFEFLYPLLPDGFHNLADDLFLSSLGGGALAGLGVGLVLRAGATTGGTDTLASILKKRRPHMKMSVLMFAIDFVVIAASAFVFGVSESLYAVVTVAITSFVIDYIVEGPSNARAVYIVSEAREEISRRVLVEMERGVTVVSATGAYTGEKRDMLYVVVDQKEIHRLARMAKEIDPCCFLTVTDVREVIGEGFARKRNEL